MQYRESTECLHLSCVVSIRLCAKYYRKQVQTSLEYGLSGQIVDQKCSVLYCAFFSQCTRSRKVWVTGWERRKGQRTQVTGMPTDIYKLYDCRELPRLPLVSFGFEYPIIFYEIECSITFRNRCAYDEIVVLFMLQCWLKVLVAIISVEWII